MQRHVATTFDVLGVDVGGFAIVKLTDLVASMLPALSLERYSITCAPGRRDLNVVTNGLVPVGVGPCGPTRPSPRRC